MKKKAEDIIENQHRRYSKLKGTGRGRAKSKMSDPEEENGEYMGMSLEDAQEFEDALFLSETKDHKAARESNIVDQCKIKQHLHSF